MNKSQTAPKLTLEDQIDVLDEKQAVFCLRILLAGNQIRSDVMQRTLELCHSVRFE